MGQAGYSFPSPRYILLVVAHIKQCNDLSVGTSAAALTRLTTTNTAGDLPLRIQTRSVVSSKATPRRNATNPHACRFAFFSTVSHQDGFHPWALLRDTACLLLGRMALGIPSVAPPYIAEYKSTGQDSPTRLGTDDLPSCPIGATTRPFQESTNPHACCI